MSFGNVVGGDFMVVRPLNRGSMGALYVAEQLSTAHHRALKVLRREYVSDETLFKRFEREAQMAAKIPSANANEARRESRVLMTVFLCPPPVQQACRLAERAVARRGAAKARARSSRSQGRSRSRSWPSAPHLW